MQLENKHYVITGASKGIGLAITRRLLELGAGVTGLSRTSPELSSQADFQFIGCDFSRLQGLAVQLKTVRKQLRRLDGVVVNAGYGRFGSLEEFSAGQIGTMIDVNLTSQILVIRELLPLLKSRKSGDVVIIGSEAALRGGQKGAVYAATKFALRGLAQSLREECAGAGVRITLINPGMVRTGFFEDLKFSPSEQPGCHLLAADIAAAVAFVLEARPGVCYDEINVSPQKKVIDFNS